MKKTRKIIALSIVTIMLSLNGAMPVFAQYIAPLPMTGGGDNILDGGETLTGESEWGNAAVYPNGYYLFAVDASASVIGEDITFTYTPTNGITYFIDPNTFNQNDANVAMSVSGPGGSCSINNWPAEGTGDPTVCVISGATAGGRYTIEIYHNDGSPCDRQTSDQPSCDALDLNSSMDASATGGGGGGGVPEFSDYMIIMTIIIAVAFMAKKLPNISINPNRRA